MGRDAQWWREYRSEWREKAHQALGGVCCQCGFTDSRALQIDHVHSDGNVERAARSRNLTTFYRHVIREAENGRYQLLCANCNWIKRHTHGEV